MIELPPLKQDLERRPVYFYRTKEQSALKLKGYDDKNNLLLKKEGTVNETACMFSNSAAIEFIPLPTILGLLKKAEEEHVEAKKEYDTILLESRDPDFKIEYGIEKVNPSYLQYIHYYHVVHAW